MKKLAIILLAMALSASPALADRVVLLFSGAQTATAQSQAVDTQGFRAAIAALRVTATGGTVTAFNLFLEGSFDGGTTWFEAYGDKLDTTTGTGTETTAADKRDLERAVAGVATDTKTLQYGNLHGLPPLLRANLTLTGTTPSETFSLWLHLK